MATPFPASIHTVPQELPSAVEINNTENVNISASIPPQDRATASSPSPSTSSSTTADSSAAKSSNTTKTASSSLSTLARLSAIAKATTKLHFISALIPPSLGPKHAAALIHIQAPPPVMAIEFKPLILTPVNFSLTDGTDIPAPPDSPPMTPVNEKVLDDVNENLDLGKENGEANKENELPTPVTTPTNDSPRQSTGIRKFLSLRGLRGQSRLHKSPPSKASTRGTLSRPATSRSADSATLSAESPMANSLKHKRSAGWFGNRRKSAMILQVPQSPVKAGPPPPTIPELKALNEEELQADDLFKNIK